MEGSPPHLYCHRKSDEIQRLRGPGSACTLTELGLHKTHAPHFFKGGIYCEMVIPRLKKRIPSRLFEIANDKEAVRKMLLWGGIRGFSGPCVIAVYPINTYSCCVLSVAHPKSPRESWSVNPIRLLTDSSPGNREYPNSYVYLKKELII